MQYRPSFCSFLGHCIAKQFLRQQPQSQAVNENAKISGGIQKARGTPPRNIIQAGNVSDYNSQLPPVNTTLQSIVGFVLRDVDPLLSEICYCIKDVLMCRSRRFYRQYRCNWFFRSYWLHWSNRTGGWPRKYRFHWSVRLSWPAWPKRFYRPYRRPWIYWMDGSNWISGTRWTSRQYWSDRDDWISWKCWTKRRHWLHWLNRTVWSNR